MLRQALILFMLFLPVLSFGQEKTLVEQLAERVDANPDSVRLVSLSRLATFSDAPKKNPYHHLLGIAYKKLGDYDSAIFHLTVEDSLFSDYTPSLEDAVNNKTALADVYYVKGELVNSEKYYNSALEMVEGTADYKLKTGVLLSVGWLSRERGQHAQALDYYFQAMRHAYANNDEDLLANCYGKIAIVYNVKGDLEKAEEYYYKSLDIRLKNNNMMAVASLYNNIGLMHDYAKDYDTAIWFFEKAMHISDSLGDDRGVAIANENIGLMYYQKREHLPHAIDRLKLSLDYWRSKDDIFGQCQTLVYITYIYNEQKNYNAALDSAFRALDFATEAGARDVEREALHHISIAYEGLGNTSQAFGYYKRFIQVRDQLEALNTTSQIDMLAMEHEFATRHFEDSLSLALEHEKEQAVILVDVEAGKFWNKLLLFGLLGLVVLVVLAVIIGRQQKQSARLIKKANLMLQVKNKEIIDSITYAKRIQTAILPAADLIRSIFKNSFVFYRPKDIVAGDFYWLSEVTVNNQKLVYFAVADCTGHGVPGAMVSVICSTALNKAVNEMRIGDPGQVLNMVTDLVIETFEKSDIDLKDGMDIALCSFNQSTGELHYSGANNAIWIISDRPELLAEGIVMQTDNKNLYLHEIKANKQPVGKYEKRIPFLTHSVRLKTNDLIYLFTDGYADQFGGLKNKKYKYLSLKKLLLSVATQEVDKQRAALKESFDTWKGAMEQVDDVCVVGIRV
jgi:tetratricopeptide (TPR) repeat protein